MWQLYTTAQHRPPFYLKLETLFEDDDTKTTYLLQVTNYVKLWSQHFSMKKLLNILSECNPDIEFTNEQRFLHTGLHLLKSPKDVNRMNFTEVGNELNVNLVRITGFVLKINLNLPLCSPQQFFDIVTRPLLLIIDDLRKSEGALRTLLKQKDQEIALFAQECGENFSMMKCFSTPKYLDEVHMKKYSVYEDLIGSHENCVVPNEVLNSHPLPNPHNFIIKEEPLEKSSVSIATTKVKIDPKENNTTSSNPITTSIKTEVHGSTRESFLKTEPQSNASVKTEPIDFTSNEPPKKVELSNNVSSEMKPLGTNSKSDSVGLANNCARLDPGNIQPKNEKGQWAKKSPVKRKKLNY